MQSWRSNRASRAVNWVITHPWYILLVVGVLAVVNWVVGTRTEPYIVKAEFSSGFNLVPGLPVDIHGYQVGMITGVKYDKSVQGGEAIVSIGIKDKQFRPLHEGTRVEARWGSTIGNGTRRLDVTPGAASNKVIPNQGIIQTDDTLPAQDVDQQLNIFTSKTRGKLTNLLGEVQGGFQGESQQLHQGINAAPQALNAANGIFQDLNSDSYALKHLVSAGDSVTKVLSDRQAGVQRLITSASTTFATFADHTGDIQNTISDLPQALINARVTLGKLNNSVHIVRGLIDDIKPGAKQLAPLATALVPTLTSLHTLVPTALSTVKTATKSAPSITRLLKTATPFVPKVTSMSNSLAPMVGCIRPYAPEAGSAVTGLSEWIDDYILEKPHQGLVQFIGKQDGQFVEQHGVRAMPEASLESFHGYPVNSEQFVQLSHKQYDYIRAPGFTVGQSWYQPQCGVTADGLNAAKDPEAGS